MAELRKEVTSLYRRYIRSSDERVQHNYKQVLRKYKNLCTKAKDRHRKQTNEVIPDETKMAKHIKTLSEQICPQIGSVIKPDGSHSLIGKDTHDIIMASHFPQITEQKQTSYQNQKTVPQAELSYLYANWLSVDRINLALNCFKDKKTCLLYTSPSPRD